MRWFPFLKVGIKHAAFRFNLFHDRGRCSLIFNASNSKKLFLYHNPIPLLQQVDRESNTSIVPAKINGPFTIH